MSKMIVAEKDINRMFLIIIQIFRTWYNYVLPAILMGPYTYILLGLWFAITLLFAHALFRNKDYFLVRWHQELKSAIIKAALLGLFLTTLSIALYDTVLGWMAESKFFISDSVYFMQISMHLTSQTSLSALVQRRILTILFLLLSTPSVWYFAESCNCWVSDKRVWDRIFWATLGSAVSYYVLGMVLGFV